MSLMATEPATRTPTVADLVGRLDPALLGRILLIPAPGTARVEDVVALEAHENRLCELVDGMLVEKTMGFKESRLAIVLAYFLERFLEQNDLGIVLGADGMFRLAPGLVRIPDVSFVAWDQLPGRRLPEAQVPSIHPDLAVEILSPSNTAAEMDRKLRDYFASGARLVWYLDPADRTARAHTAFDRMTTIDEAGALDGWAVLPGFRLELRDWFARVERPGGGGGMARA